MYSQIERVIILKTVSIFKDVPDHILAHLAGRLGEVTLEARETIFNKGDLGDTMYIIAQGKLRAHDGDIFFNYLEERDVFGEMAVLDPEPRVASITAEESTVLLCLDQATFYEVMADYPEISRAVMRVIIGYLRDRIKDYSDLKKQIETTTHHTGGIGA